MANDARLVDHKGDAVGEKAGEVQYAISFGHLLPGVAQKRKARTGFLGEFAVSLLAVDTNPHYLGARGLKPGDITLIRLDLFGSTGSGGTNVEGQDYGFLAAKIPELSHLAVLVGQGKVGGAITNLYGRGCSKQWHKDYAQPGNHREFPCSAHLSHGIAATPPPFHAKLGPHGGAEDVLVSMPSAIIRPKPDREKHVKAGAGRSAVPERSR